MKTPLYGDLGVDQRPREDTILDGWLRARDVSAFEFAKRLGVDPKTICALAQGRQIPGLILAFKIEQVTEGGVPVESWLGTELGRVRFHAQTFDWDGWLEAKAAATARHDQKRKRAQ